MDVWKLSQGRYKYLNQDFQKPAAHMSDSKSDVKVLVGQKTFYAHREVLSSHSDYFEAMFSVNMKEKGEKEIKLYELDSEGFSRILDYFYRGYITVDADVAEAVLDAASFLQCHWLITVSCDFLVRHASVLTYEKVLELADRYTLGDLHADIFHHLGQNFLELSKSSSWTSMSVLLLEELLTGDYYIEAPESAVLHSLLHWLQHVPEVSSRQVEIEDRTQYRELLLASIKYPLVEEASLKELPNWVYELPTVKELLNTAEVYHSNVFAQPSIHSALTEPRGSAEVLALLSAADGEVQFLEPNSGLTLSEQINLNALEVTIEHAQMLFWGNCLFIVGGYDSMCLSSDSAYRLSYGDARRRIWEQIGSLQTPRVTFALVATDKHLYAIGGVNHVVLDGRDVDLYLPTVECYDSELNLWQEVEALPHGLCELAAVTVGDKIYISGGIADSEFAPVPAPYVMCYTNNHWESLAPLITGRKRHAMMHYEHKLYVVGGQVAAEEHALDSVGCVSNEVYDLELDQWTQLAPSPSADYFQRVLTPASVVGGMAFFLGGENTSLRLLQFNLSTGEWCEETSACGDHAQRLTGMRVPLPIMLAPVRDGDE